MQRILIILGAILLLAGLAWPWLRSMGLFRLPGDIMIRRDGFTFYFPIITCAVLSIAISLLVWLFRH
jgi:hypothetical protein